MKSIYLRKVKQSFKLACSIRLSVVHEPKHRTPVRLLVRIFNPLHTHVHEASTNLPVCVNFSPACHIER